MPENTDIYASPRPADGTVNIRVRFENEWREIALPVPKAHDFGLEVLNKASEVRIYWKKQAP